MQGNGLSGSIGTTISLAVNRHSAVLGAGGRGGSFGNDPPIPQAIGADQRNWRRLPDRMFAPTGCTP